MALSVQAARLETCMVIVAGDRFNSVIEHDLTRFDFVT
jgi:hypothetical protein